jgi:hypothetical protein
MRLITAAKFTYKGIGIRSCLENFGARQPGDGDATVPSLSEWLGRCDLCECRGKQRLSTAIEEPPPDEGRRLFVFRLMVSTNSKDAKDTKSLCLSPKFTQQLTMIFSQSHFGHRRQIR